METAVVLGIFGLIFAVFGYMFHLVSQIRSSHSKQIDILQEKINLLENQSPLVVAEDLEKRIKITEGELLRLREENERYKKTMQEARDLTLEARDQVFEVVEKYSSSTLDNVSLVYKEKEEDKPLRQEVEGFFWISHKFFDGSSKPQRIVVTFTNSGNDVLLVWTVRYSDTGFSRSLPQSALKSTYRRDSRSDYIVFDGREEVMPDQEFTVVLELEQEWKFKDINRLSGRWGYLKLDVAFRGKQLGLFFEF